MFLHPAIYNVLVCSDVFLAGKIMAVLILSQSWLFTYRMITSIKRRFAEIAERNKRGIKFVDWTSPIPKKELENCQFYISAMSFKEKLP